MPNTGRRPEQQIQRALFQHLALRAVPGAVAYHPFNGGFRKPVEAAIAKALGVLPGIPDVAIVARGEPFFLELKAPGGRLSAAQVDCQERLANAGAHVATAIGIDAALDQLAAWQLLRPSR